MVLYRTYFYLTNEVIDFDAARKYLIEDDMTNYLVRDSRLPKSISSDEIIKIEWILTSEDSGHIDLYTTREFTDEELECISDWVSGQNSDGLGEGFEQQDFACYNLNDDYYDYDDDYDEEDYVMASFDWRTNDYIFELVK